MLASEIPERREILLPDALLSLEDVNQWVSWLTKMLDEPGGCLKRLRDDQGEYARKLCFNWNAHFLSAVLC